MNNLLIIKTFLSTIFLLLLIACEGGKDPITPQQESLPTESKSNDLTIDITSKKKSFEINKSNEPFTVQFVFSEPIYDFHPAEATVKNASFRTGRVNLSELSSEFEIIITPNNKGKDIEISVPAAAGKNRNGKENLASSILIIKAVDTLAPELSLESKFSAYNTLGAVQNITLQLYSNEPITGINFNSITITNASLVSTEEINSNNHQIVIIPDGTDNNVTVTIPTLSISDLSGISNTLPVSITIYAEEKMPLIAAQAKLKFGIKKFIFEWLDAPDATYYNILEQVGDENYTTLSSNIEKGINTYTVNVSLASKVDAKYILQSCNPIGCTDDTTLYAGNMLGAIGYIKTTESKERQLLGKAISLNSDATVLAIGAPGSPYFTIDEANIREEWIPGSVYLFRKIDGTWLQEQKLQAPEPENNDGFGNSVSLSSDGNTLAIGSYKENSSSLGINSIANNDKILTGAVYVYKNRNSTWQQDAYIKPSYSYKFQLFGTSSKLSADGNTLVVGAPGSELNFSGPLSNPLEAVYIFKKKNDAWYQQDYINEYSIGENINFGESVEINHDGTEIFVGAPYSDHISGDDTVIKNTGLAFSYTLNADDQWEKVQTFSPTSFTRNFALGMSISLSGNNEKLALGSYSSYDNKGEVSLYSNINNQWEFNASIKPSNPNNYNTLKFSQDMALNFDGTLLAIGAPSQRGPLQGVNLPTDDSASKVFAGAAYIYKLQEGLWEESAYLKSANPDNSFKFGTAIDISMDGKTIAIGDPTDNSSLTGISPNLDNPDEDTVQASGSVSIF
ncbi:FG-GAP repeat protein [Pseudomonas sp. HK3]|jgi:hypothetical protein